mgnify:CR=1 FL=1
MGPERAGVPVGERSEFAGHGRPGKMQKGKSLVVSVDVVSEAGGYARNRLEVRAGRLEVSAGRLRLNGAKRLRCLSGQKPSGGYG